LPEALPDHNRVTSVNAERQRERRVNIAVHIERPVRAISSRERNVIPLPNRQTLADAARESRIAGARAGTNIDLEVTTDIGAHAAAAPRHAHAKTAAAGAAAVIHIPRTLADDVPKARVEGLRPRLKGEWRP